MIKHIAAAVIAAVLASSSAFAADITFEPTDCKGNGTKCGFIVVNGKILDGDEQTFASVSKGIDRVFVILNSPGGHFDAGLNIARQIKNNEWNTGADAFCASICAVMWLSGSTRYYKPSSRIGFHGVLWAASDRNGNMIHGSTRVASGGTAVLGAYFAKLGLPEKTIDILASPGPNEMYWLETKNLKQLGIKAERIVD